MLAPRTVGGQRHGGTGDPKGGLSHDDAVRCFVDLAARSSPPLAAHALRPRAKVELALLALLYVAYSLGRMISHAGVPTATAHARDLLHLEALLHLDIERRANQLLDSVPLARSLRQLLVRPAPLHRHPRRPVLGLPLAGAPLSPRPQRLAPRLARARPSGPIERIDCT